VAKTRGKNVSDFYGHKGAGAPSAQG